MNCKAFLASHFDASELKHSVFVKKGISRLPLLIQKIIISRTYIHANYGEQVYIILKIFIFGFGIKKNKQTLLAHSSEVV